jgi:preprotein translocase subunit SecD
MFTCIINVYSNDEKIKINFRIENEIEYIFLDGSDIVEIKILEERFMENIFISFTLTENGRMKFYEITKNNIGENINIYYDSLKIISVIIFMPINTSEIVLQSELNEKMINFINILMANNIIEWDWALLENS